MDDIIIGDQLYITNEELVNYSSTRRKPCRKHDLIMILNAHGSYLFAECGRNESPIFKIREIQPEYGQVQLHLTVMEVSYPNCLLHSGNNRANILYAIREGIAVVKESDSVITFTLGKGQRIEKIQLKEIKEYHRITVKSPIYVKGDCQEGIEGAVKVQGHCPYPNAFFLTKRPKKGTVKLNEKTGEWIYHSNEACDEQDTFEISVWNFAGGCATQCIYVSCEQSREPVDVNITNVPLPVIVTNPVPVFGDVRVINTPTVNIDEPIDVNVLTIPEVTIASLPPVEISGTPTVIIDSAETLSVTIPGVVEVCIIDAELTVLVETVVFNQVITADVISLPEVTIANELTIASLPAVEISGLVSVTVPEILTVTIEQPVDVNVLTLPQVSLTGTPTVVISGTVPVTGTVGITGTPTVLVGNPVSISGTVPVTGTVSITGTPAVTITGTIPVTGTVGITGTPTVLVGNPVSISGTPTVAISTTVPVTGTVSITGTPLVLIANPVSISGTPTVVISTTVPVAGNVGITGTPTVLVGNAVSLSGTPAVTINGLVSVTLPELLAVTVAQPLNVNVLTLPEVNIASLPAVEVSGLVSVTVPDVVTVTVLTPVEVIVVTSVSTETSLDAYNFYQAMTTLTVPADGTSLVTYDVSRSIDNTLFAHLVSGSTVLGEMVVSPTLNVNYFYPTGITQALSSTSPNYPFVSNHYGRYVGISFVNNTPTTAEVEVIAQSQGPITQN